MQLTKENAKVASEVFSRFLLSTVNNGAVSGEELRFVADFLAVSAKRLRSEARSEKPKRKAA